MENSIYFTFNLNLSKIFKFHDATQKYNAVSNKVCQYQKFYNNFHNNFIETRTDVSDLFIEKKHLHGFSRPHHARVRER